MLMRFRLLGLILLAGTAMPAVAQRADTVERRVDRLEQQVRAVQRRVFPDGNVPVEPEIGPAGPVRPGGNVSGDALSTLTSRVDAVETQLRALTGQVEENGYRTRQLEEQVARLRTDLQARLDRVEQQAEPAPAPAAAAPAPREAPPRATPRREPRAEPAAAPPPVAAPAAAPAAATDAAEEAYNAGYRLWDQRRFAEAQTALDAAATRYPNSRWASWSRNLQGRAYLDDDKPATAARILLANYQDNPRGERAADSLYFLGQALTRLERRPEACRVYDELAQVYPNMRDYIRTRLPAARTAARCTAN
jgi:TolA-binding protein